VEFEFPTFYRNRNKYSSSFLFYFSPSIKAESGNLSKTLLKLVSLSLSLSPSSSRVPKPNHTYLEKLPPFLAEFSIPPRFTFSADMATEEIVHAAEVSKAFLDQYYHIIGIMPEEARKFYVDASVVTRPGPHGTMMSCTSVEAINEHFVSSNYEGTTFEVLSVDSQNSVEDGVFIMVIGLSTVKDNKKRKFFQMFYLARQTTAYVVLNDILRYVDEQASTPITPPVVEPVPEVEIAKPVEEISNKSDASAENSVVASEVKKVAENVVVDAASPLDNGKTKQSDEKDVAAQKPREPVAETAAAPQLDGGKKSYAAMVESLARNAAPFQVKAAVQKPRLMGQPRAAAAPRAPASTAAAAPRAPAASVGKFEKKNDQRMIEEPGTSIFVSNLPMDAVPPQLHELFKDFGPIKEHGIQVRSNRGSGVCFGFIAFESATSVQSVLQAAKNNPFKLADRTLLDYDGRKPSGGRSGGGSKTQNGSADGGDELRRNRNRRNGGRNERRGDRNANGDSNQKNSEGGAAPEVQA
ncbi:unnamed protein product, partial [Thlaspi arvense]